MYDVRLTTSRSHVGHPGRVGGAPDGSPRTGPPDRHPPRGPSLHPPRAPDARARRPTTYARPGPVMPARPEVRTPSPITVRPPPISLGIGVPRGYGMRPRLSPEAAAAFATYVDSARARAAIEGRTLIYTVRWG